MQYVAPQDKTSYSWHEFVCNADSTYVYDLSLLIPFREATQMIYSEHYHISKISPQRNSTFVIFLSVTSILYVYIFVYYL